MHIILINLKSNQKNPNEKIPVKRRKTELKKIHI
jgi:hypothetical protein